MQYFFIVAHCVSIYLASKTKACVADITCGFIAYL